MKNSAIQLSIRNQILTCLFLFAIGTTAIANTPMVGNPKAYESNHVNVTDDSDILMNSYALPNKFRPSFENIPVWRLQLRVQTANKKNGNTDDEVMVKFNGPRSSEFYLDRAGDDREKNKVDTYDIMDPNIRTIRDIKFMHLMLMGNDGWCIKNIEILINDVKTPVFRKSFKSCHWLDGDNKKYHMGLFVSGLELRKSPQWKYTNRNKNIWLPPFLIKRATIEAMVESYVGHMMNAEQKMRGLEFGKKHGRAYVEARKAGAKKLKFDLDLVYKINNAPDVGVDVDFNLAVLCSNNKISMRAESVVGKPSSSVIRKVLRMLEKVTASFTNKLKGLSKMSLGDFNVGTSDVPFCPTIKVKPTGDISIRP